MRVVRVITYEGPEQWLETQIRKSLPDGITDSGITDRLGAADCIITLTTVLDERPSRIVPIEAVEEVNRQCQ